MAGPSDCAVRGKALITWPPISLVRILLKEWVFVLVFLCCAVLWRQRPLRWAHHYRVSKQIKNPLVWGGHWRTTEFKMVISWSVPRCSMVASDRRFRVSYHLHHHYPDDGGSKHLRSVETTRRCIPKTAIFINTRRRENVKCHLDTRSCKVIVTRSLAFLS
jgi:hypothetical protein